jgi:hypothetical protein
LHLLCVHVARITRLLRANHHRVDLWRIAARRNRTRHTGRILRFANARPQIALQVLLRLLLHGRPRRDPRPARIRGVWLVGLLAHVPQLLHPLLLPRDRLCSCRLRSATRHCL